MKSNNKILYLMLCVFIFGIIWLMSFFKAFAYENDMETTIITLKDIQTDIRDFKAQTQLQYDALHNEMKSMKTYVNNVVPEDEVVQKDQISNRWDITLTDDEVDLLARIVMLEAGGESALGQEAVVEVIFNRIYDEDFPDTLEGVLSQKGQFTTWKNRNIKAATPTDEVYESINSVLTGQTDILPFATVYFSRGGERGKQKQIVIENHVFCNK